MLRTRRSRLAITALVAITLTSFGCASSGGPNPAICATVGAVLGGGAGVAIADGHEHDRDDIRGGAAGAVVLGTAGYFICKALAQEPPPPPPPEPPPPPAPRVVPEAPVQRIVLRGVNFDFDKSAIRSDAAVILDEAVRLLAGGSQSVLIEGHTDWTGPDAYNQGLSERRAESVRSYLVEHGIAPGRLRSQGLGESQRIASNETRDGRALNRRVELEVQD